MPTTCALCRRVIPDERIADPQAVQEHHLRPERRAQSPTVILCLDWIRGTEKLDIDVTTSNRVRDRR